MRAETDQERLAESRAVWKLALYVLGIVIVSVLLLGINAGMIFGLAKALEERMANIPLIDPITQYAIYVVPMLLLCLEWYAWDILSASRRRNRI
jgi:hypothetical protein